MEVKGSEKEFNRSLKLIVKSSVLVLVGLLLSKVLSYFYRVVIARYYGPEIYGVFSLSIIIILWLSSICFLGLSEGTLRYISFYRGKKYKEGIKYLFRLSVITLFISSTIGAFLLYAFSEFISTNIFNEPSLTLFLKIFATLMPFYIILYLFLTVFRAHEKILTYTFLIEFMDKFLKLALLILFIFIGLKATGIIFSYFMGIFLTFLVAFFYLKYKLSYLFKKGNINQESRGKIRKEVFSFSLPLIFSGFIYGIMPYIDSLTIGYFQNAYNVGLYNAALPIAALMNIAPNLFLRLFLPLATKEFSNKKYDLINQLSKQVSKWVLILNLPLCLLTIVFPGTFINLLFGSEFLTPAAEMSLRLLSASFLFYSFSLVFNSLIQMSGKSKLILINIFTIAIFNLVLNIILVPIYGIVGAAFSTLIGNIFLFTIYLFQVRYFTKILPLRRKMIRLIISALIPTIILIFTKKLFLVNKFTLFLSAIFFLLLYVLLIFVTRGFDDNDLNILNSFKEKYLNKKPSKNH